MSLASLKCVSTDSDGVHISEMSKLLFLLPALFCTYTNKRYSGTSPIQATLASPIYGPMDETYLLKVVRRVRINHSTGMRHTSNYQRAGSIIVDLRDIYDLQIRTLLKRHCGSRNIGMSLLPSLNYSFV